MRLVAVLGSFVVAATLLTAAGATGDGTVVQRGHRNYAGPHCPGAGWTCTTATDVVQVAAKGGVNRFECGRAECSVTQMGDVNWARCDQRSGKDAASQRCSIRQTGWTNDAFVKQWISQRHGPFQLGIQDAAVTQAAKGGGNNAQVAQRVVQWTDDVGGTPSLAEQRQSADQALEVSQDAGEGAKNRVHGDQDLDQRATADVHSADSVLQRQNTGDLQPSTPKNVHAEIVQVSDTGANMLHLSQSDAYRADANAGGATIRQRQGSTGGGLDATARQDGVDVTHATVKQKTSQRANARTHGEVSQNQIAGDPKCCSSFVGNPHKTKVHVDQTVMQRASEGAEARQTAFFFGLFRTTGDGRLVQTAATDEDRQTIVTRCSPGTCRSIVVCGDRPKDEYPSHGHHSSKKEKFCVPAGEVRAVGGP